MESGLKKIIDKILSEARKEEESIISEANKEAKTIIQQSKKEAEAEAAKIKKKYEKEAAQIKERAKASARLKCKLQYLKAENKVIENAFAQAEKDLMKFKKTRKYLSFLEKEIVKALANEGKGKVELVVANSDRKLFNKAFLKRLESKTKRNLKLAKKSAAILGGVIISLPEKGVDINCSFDAKLVECREQKIAEIAKILYQKGGKK